MISPLPPVPISMCLRDDRSTISAAGLGTQIAVVDQAEDSMFKMSTCGVGLVLAGLVACSNQSSSAPSDGAILGRVPTNHRASDIECTQAAPAGTCSCNGNCPTSTYPSQWACSSDGDCGDAGINGRCTGSLGPAGCGCTYDSCVTRQDDGATSRQGHGAR